MKTTPPPESVLDRAARAVAERFGELAEGVGLARAVELDSEHRLLGREAVACGPCRKHDARARCVAGVGIAAVVTVEAGIRGQDKRAGIARFPVRPCRVGQRDRRELLPLANAHKSQWALNHFILVFTPPCQLRGWFRKQSPAALSRMLR